MSNESLSTTRWQMALTESQNRRPDLGKYGTWKVLQQKRNGASGVLETRLQADPFLKLAGESVHVGISLDRGHHMECEAASNVFQMRSHNERPVGFAYNPRVEDSRFKKRNGPSVKRPSSPQIVLLTIFLQGPSGSEATRRIRTGITVIGILKTAKWLHGSRWARSLWTMWS
ncbi:hypothetical protein L596_020425 [Steinernema carpocapsae]|uniref:Uncharacterized protein n=1 Tax=Steinernema carpocapsae TaxID=34508 RepID=A0A4U5MTH6_STECR|nr:hypothetical protein L596_020425 [Steinernema carpocapsae]